MTDQRVQEIAEKREQWLKDYYIKHGFIWSEKAMREAYDAGRREGMSEAAGICDDDDAEWCAAAIREKINSQQKASKK